MYADVPANLKTMETSEVVSNSTKTAQTDITQSAITTDEKVESIALEIIALIETVMITLFEYSPEDVETCVLGTFPESEKEAVTEKIRQVLFKKIDSMHLDIAGPRLKKMFEPREGCDLLKDALGAVTWKKNPTKRQKTE
jgi:hypothetical protein